MFQDIILLTRCKLYFRFSDFRSPVFVNCPKSIRVRNEEGMDSATVNYEKPMAFDSSNVTVELISGQQSGERFDLGIHRIYYRAEDESGNRATCTFYILVIGNVYRTIHPVHVGYMGGGGRSEGYPDT